MSGERSTYLRWLAIAADWAAESGMPPQLVLRRQCEWAVTGAFPDGAFITATGTKLAPFDIYMSFRAAADPMASLAGIHLDGCTIQNNDRWGMHVLAEVLVTDQDLLAFCENTNTLAPRALLSGFNRFVASWDGSKRLAPPACPDADEHAARIMARDTATGWMNNLRSTLSGLKGKPTWLGPRVKADEPIDFEFWAPKWTKIERSAQSAIDRCRDVGLQQQLDSLNAEWAAFVAEKTSVLSVAAGDAEIGRQAQQNPDARSGNVADGKRRGRPLGSGSLAVLDAPLLEQMRQAIVNDPSLSPTAAAIRLAEQAAGGGTPDSKAKRLVERYSRKFKTD